MHWVLGAVTLDSWYLNVSTSMAPEVFPCGNPPPLASSGVWRPKGPNESPAQRLRDCIAVVTGLPPESYTQDLGPSSGYGGPYFLSNSLARLLASVGSKFV